MSKIDKYSFLTSNTQKAKDFKMFGFGVKEFKEEIKEIKCPLTDVIALYKANDTNLNDIMVEDTGLHIEGSPHCGTEIKYVYEIIKDDPSYQDRFAKWVVAICLKTENGFYVAQGVINGFLDYPASKHGYHFENIFAINVNGENKKFADLTEDERKQYNPRFMALAKLRHALENEDYSSFFHRKKKTS